MQHPIEMGNSLRFSGAKCPRPLLRQRIRALRQDAVFLSYREFVESIRVPAGREVSWRDFTGVDAHQAFKKIRGMIAAGSGGRRADIIRALNIMFSGV